MHVTDDGASDSFPGRALVEATNRFARRVAPEEADEYEGCLLNWAENLGLLREEHADAWVQISERGGSASYVEENHGDFFVHLKRTIGALGHTSSIAETLWAIFREVVGDFDSTATANSKVKYKFDMGSPLNEQTKNLTRSEEEVQQRRVDESKTIRERATHTAAQRVEHVRLLKVLLRGRYTGLEPKSRHFYRNKKKKQSITCQRFSPPQKRRRRN